MGHSGIVESGLSASAPTTATVAADELHLVLRTEADTDRLAQALAACAELRDCFIELRGDLGAGKTTWVRHLLRALGAQGRIKSPTYAVVEPYELALGPVWHFDFYRFSDPAEWADAGFRDIFASPGLKLVEWPERAQPLLPQPDLLLRLQLASIPEPDGEPAPNAEGLAADGAAEASRIASLCAGSPAGARLLHAAASVGLPLWQGAPGDPAGATPTGA